MFSNLRYVAVSVFFILALLTLLAGVYFKDSITDNVLKMSIEQETKILAESYVRSVWNRYYPVVSFVSDKGEHEWKLYPQYLTFINESQSIFSAPNLIQADIYTHDNTRLFRSNDAILTEKTSFFSLTSPDRDKNSIASAIQGKSTIIAIPSIQVNDNGKVSNRAIFKSFIPITVSNSKGGIEDLALKAKGVLELNFDVTDMMKKIDELQFILVFLVMSALAILTMAVFIASQKAELVIERQQEVSLEMASAKASAESESKAKSQFLANVSHELRTPLNAIIGFSEIISSEAMGPLNNEQYKDFVKDIHTSGVHLLSLINDILDFSKAEENKLQVDFEQVDVTKIAKMCIRMVLPRAEQAKVHLAEEIPAEHIIANVDAKRLKQVILNILSNSVKFTPENGRVKLKLWKNGDNHTVVIEISDTGVGMAAQDLAKALAPFAQVDNKLSRRYEGTGLGLPLTKKLVELMRGIFEIKSEVGLGTTVTISFSLSSSDLEVDLQSQTKGLVPTPLVP